MFFVSRNIRRWRSRLGWIGFYCDSEFLSSMHVTLIHKELSSVQDFESASMAPIHF